MKKILVFAVLAVSVAVCGRAWATYELEPGETMTWSTILADVDDQRCDDNLVRVWLLRAMTPTPTLEELAENRIANLPAPSLDGFDENDVPYVVTFEGIPQGNMVAGESYYFFIVLEDAAGNLSPPSPPSDDTVYGDRPPRAVGTAPFHPPQ